ncbi:Heterokaryon incompatibility protein 6 OR allele-like protein [Pyrenophora tritici-repentis]|nr:Heterokaryon incompatibility protein 6 OR allele-like protein [Pyrenophora tritici-repentis]
MTHDLILKSFQATGVWPMDADPVLQRFNNQPQQQDDEPGIGEQGDGDTWPQLRKIFDAAVADKAKFEAKRLSQGLHSLQVNNELFRLQNAELRAELNLMRSRPSKSTTLTTQEGDDWHGGAVFYSPRKLASVRARKAAELDEAAELQLQKARDRERKAAEAAEKKRSQEAAKVARQQAKIERDAEQLRQREEKAAERALKKQQQQAATAQKSRDTANKRGSGSSIFYLEALMPQPRDHQLNDFQTQTPLSQNLILVGDALFHVTKSLEVALSHLTPEDKPLTLWIDALCIDQDDEVEKTEQVQQMQQIYSKATSVIAWLGPAAENSDAAMHWIQRYGSLSHELGIGTRPELRLRQLLQMFELDPDKLPHEGLRGLLRDISTQLSPGTYGSEGIGMALSKLFKRAYWSRIWVVQELVHAKCVQFVCGNMAVSEEPLHHSLRLLRNFGQYQHFKSAQHPQAIDSEIASASIHTRNPVNTLKIRRAVGPFPLIYLIRTLRYFQATDPRDRIFALLSFAADAAALDLRPDYRKSCKEVYIETTISLLRNGIFDILSLCEAHEEISELPSWVPDFTRISYRVPLQQRAMKREAVPVTTVLQPRFSASGDNQDTSVSYERTQGSPIPLLLHAKFVDEVKHLGTTWEPQAFGLWLQELREFSHQDPTLFGPHHLRAVWRTAVADQEIRQGNQKPRLSERGLAKVHNSLRSLDLGTANARTFAQLGLEDYLYQLQDVAYGRRPFCTSKGHIGIGPCQMAPGDLLYLLIGTDVPYILRPDSDGKLRLVGEAYAHGIMDGEAMEDGPPVDVIAMC